MAVLSVAAPMPRPKSIVIVDPESTTLLEEALTAGGYRVHTASTPRAATRILGSERADVIIADGLDVLLGARRSHPHAIRIAMAKNPSVELVMRAINEAHVHRFLLKPCLPAVVTPLVRELLPHATAPDDVRELTPRLRETLEVVMTGASEKQIADQLGISHHTAHQYIQALFRAFGVTSRAQLMARVLRR